MEELGRFGRERSAETGEQGRNRSVDILELTETDFLCMKMQKSFSTFCPSRTPVMFNHSLAKLRICSSYLRRDEKVSKSYLNDTGNANLNCTVRHRELQFPSRPFFVASMSPVQMVALTTPKPPTISRLPTQNSSDSLSDHT